MNRTRPLAAALAAAALLTACGDDSDDVAAATTTTASAEEASTTTAPTAETATTVAAEQPDAAGGIVGPDAEAAANTVVVVFDSSIPFEEKVALIEGGEAHRADHEAYLGAADAVGGITIVPTAAAVDGDAATVTYGIQFAGSTVYEDLTIDVVRVDGTWTVSTAAFCGFLASARTSCAAA